MSLGPEDWINGGTGDSSLGGVRKEACLEWIQGKFREEMEVSIGISFKELCSTEVYRNGPIASGKNRVKESVWMKTGKRKVVTCELEV